MQTASLRLLIDGYNLLYASDVFASNEGPPTFERTRAAFLDVLAERLEERIRRRTMIVFDAAQAPPGLPHELSVAGMQIRFSRRPQAADDLLEDVIAAIAAPRELLVVSSDHRVQRAARQRGAAYIDSELWWAECMREPRETKASTEEPVPPLDWNPFPPGYAEDLLPKEVPTKLTSQQDRRRRRG